MSGADRGAGDPAAPPSAAASANPLRVGMESQREPVPCTLVMFGATGDLTHRKLLPAIYNLAWEGLLHPDTSVVGVARRDWTDEKFHTEMREGVDRFSRRRPVDNAVWTQLCGDLSYVCGEFQDEATYRKLGERLRAIDAERGHPGVHLFYLATPPSAYPTIIQNLGRAGLVRAPGQAGASRIVVEKPFGRDLASARALNDTLLGVFDEDQVFRIDHYLGKETVQNILVFRLDNGIFEPLWNSRYVDHVQIAVAESVGLEGRAGYYEEAGVLRDMLQNHLLQLMMLVCMEPPVRFDAKSVRDEKAKVLRSIVPFAPDEIARRVVRGQYGAGLAGGESVPGYREEPGVATGSRTDTYLALKLEAANWRWAGTPFYLRSGKRLPKRATEIGIVFKKPPYELFRGSGAERPRSNVLRLRIQPDEGISLSFESKAPAQAMRIDEVRMDFNYSTSFGKEPPEAYERLLLDAITGDSTLFARRDEVELAWSLVDPIAEAWGAERNAPEPAFYEAGTWGPAEADRLLEADGRRWLRL